MNEGQVRQPGMDTGTQIRRGVTIGRYVVLGLVGRGAMGDVYSAYDPDLDRKVAIKLLRVKRGGSQGGLDGKTRLLREAQAIAKLSHPNVIVVYDVGTFEDSVFIAMEFIEGGTLNFWLHAQKRDWREILRAFISAGRGLQHAHEAKLVHRDFKPDNVMIRVDGEVRVMDFGLVRHIDVFGSELEPRPEIGLTESQRVDEAVALDATLELGRRSHADPSGAAVGAPLDKLTQTGAMLGTPAYMAPEQFVGQAADARTDQFSFCVALYEAIFGERPFDGATMTELTGNVLDGRVKPMPQRSRIPLAVWRVLRRGLSVLPAERYPSMVELLAELGQFSHPRRRSLVMAMAVAAALALAAIGGLTFRESQRQVLCAAPTDRFDGVWELSARSGSRRAAIEFGFRTAGQDAATTTSTGRSTSWAWTDATSRSRFARVSQMLDKYVADWLTTYKDACEATNYRGDQSSQVLDLRMSCLNDRFNELRALSDSFAMPTRQMIDNAPRIVAAMGSLSRCSNVELLRNTLFRSASK
ncbi:MAG TPA: serine/threonine-protein kinase [Polyangia bacterium]